MTATQKAREARYKAAQDERGLVLVKVYVGKDDVTELKAWAAESRRKRLQGLEGKA